MKKAAEESPEAALSWFMDKIIPILEELVPTCEEQNIKEEKTYMQKVFKNSKENSDNLICFKT